MMAAPVSSQLVSMPRMSPRLSTPCCLHPARRHSSPGRQSRAKIAINSDRFSLKECPKNKQKIPCKNYKNFLRSFSLTKTVHGNIYRYHSSHWRYFVYYLNHPLNRCHNYKNTQNIPLKFSFIIIKMKEELWNRTIYWAHLRQLNIIMINHYYMIGKFTERIITVSGMLSAYVAYSSLCSQTTAEEKSISKCGFFVHYMGK